MVGSLCKRIASMLAVGVVIGFASAAVASEGSEELPTAEELIEGCWAISLDLRSNPNTDAIRAGHLDTALCLEEAIIKYASEFIDPDYLNKEEITDQMKQLRTVFGSFYWSLYNENLACEFSCGRFFHSFHNNATANAYMVILENVMFQLHEYKGRY